MHSLTDLPFDVIQVIAALLLPYDIIALGRTCHAFMPIVLERAVWIKVAEVVSLSRPLPFTAAQALGMPIERLIESCLRAERIATRWAEPQIYTRRSPVKIKFSDNRIVSYFTFLPGSRHLMMYDVHNMLSCWTTEGHLLQTWQIQHGAKLMRWKPCDESESSYDFGGRRELAAEIMIEMSNQASPTQCEILLLIYSDTHATFEHVDAFTIPRVYEPFSAMTQDELRGSLVGISSLSRGRVGIYLTDKTTEKAVCIDTGLTLVLDCVPQALLSSAHMVLYWETLSTAHTVTYEMDTLRSVLAREGWSQDDVMLRYPVPVTPSDVHVIPFRTVSAPPAEPSLSSGTMHTCCRCGTQIEQSLPSTDLSSNRDAYPVIIPKWHTLREDLRKHRTRSVLTFSRRPRSATQTAAQALAFYVNAHNHDVLNANHHVHGSESADGNGDAPAANEDGNGQAPVDDEQYAPPATDNEEYYFSRSPHLPSTTITHHYFDYTGSMSGSGQPELVRTVLAEAPLRRPKSLRIPRHPITTVVMAPGGNEVDEDDVEFDGDVGLEGFGVQHIGEYNEEDEDDEGGIELEAMGDHDFGNEQTGGYGDEEEEALHAENGLEHDHDDDHGEQLLHPNNAPLWGEDEGAPFDDLAALENGFADLGLGLELGELQGGAAGVPFHMHTHAHLGAGPFGGVDIVDLSADAIQALEEFVQDPFGGSPVIGYGGRCAMWVEEHPRKYRPNGCAAVLRVATFLSYEPAIDDALRESEGMKSGKTLGGVPIHPELEVARGRVGTLHLPGYISLESAHTFDLDDVRGVVGIATSFGEVWLVDFS